MPGMTGRDVQRRLTESDMRVPVIIIAGRDDRETEARCRAAGAAAYLPKPIDERILLDREHLGRRRAGVHVGDWRPRIPWTAVSIHLPVAMDAVDKEGYLSGWPEPGLTPFTAMNLVNRNERLTELNKGLVDLKTRTDVRFFLGKDRSTLERLYVAKSSRPEGWEDGEPVRDMTNTSSSTACGRRRRSSPRASAAPREVDRDPLLRRRLEHPHERAQEIGVRHDPDQRVAVRDGQRAEARIEHESRRVFDPGLRGYRHGIRGHDPTGDRAGRLGAGGPNVSVRDHPHQPPPGHDRQVPDAVLVHEASRRVARRLGPDRHQPAGHHISHHDHDHVAVLPARYGAEHSSTLVPSGIGRTSAETRSSAFVATR